MECNRNETYCFEVGGFLKNTASSTLLASVFLYATPVYAATQIAAPAPVIRGAAVDATQAETILGSGASFLADAISIASAGYPSVSAARSQVRAARSDLSGARWLRFPSASVEAASTGTGSGDTDWALNVEQPLWAAGRIGGTIRQNKALVQGAEAGVSEVQLEVALRVAQSFFDFQRLAMRETILEDSLTEHQKLVDSMERRVAQELSPTSDLDLARSRKSQVEQELAATNGARRAALSRLRELTGNPAYLVGGIIRYDANFHHPMADGLMDEAVAYDPKRKRLQAQARAADAEVTVKRASILPQLNAQYQRPTFGDDRVGLVLRAQTEGLSRFSSVDAARQRRQAAELQIVTAERELRETISADLLENSVSRTRVSTSGSAATSAQAVTESFMRQFVAGKRTWFDVMNAVREGTSARLSEADSRVSAVASATRLLLRSGRWMPFASEDVKR